MGGGHEAASRRGRGGPIGDRDGERQAGERGANGFAVRELVDRIEAEDDARSRLPRLEGPQEGREVAVEAAADERRAPDVERTAFVAEDTVREGDRERLGEVVGRGHQEAFDPAPRRAPPRGTRRAPRARRARTARRAPGRGRRAPPPGVSVATRWRRSHSAVSRRSAAVAGQRSSAFAPVRESVPSRCTCRNAGRDGSRRRADQAAASTAGSGPAPRRSVPSDTSTSVEARSSAGASARPGEDLLHLENGRHGFGVGVVLHETPTPGGQKGLDRRPRARAGEGSGEDQDRAAGALHVREAPLHEGVGLLPARGAAVEGRPLKPSRVVEGAEVTLPEGTQPPARQRVLGVPLELDRTPIAHGGHEAAGGGARPARARVVGRDPRRDLLGRDEVGQRVTHGQPLACGERRREAGHGQEGPPVDDDRGFPEAPQVGAPGPPLGRRARQRRVELHPRATRVGSRALHGRPQWWHTAQSVSRLACAAGIVPNPAPARSLPFR